MMDGKGNIRQMGYAGAKIQTQTIKVLVTTDDYEIEGFMHIKPGSYQSRVSDILNVKELHFIPLTNVTMHSLRNPKDPPRKADAIIVRLDTIKMVVPQEDQDKAAPEPDKPASGMAPGWAAASPEDRFPAG